MGSLGVLHEGVLKWDHNIKQESRVKTSWMVITACPNFRLHQMSLSHIQVASLRVLARAAPEDPSPDSSVVVFGRTPHSC